MANEILIKRSSTTVAPTNLLFGEMAFGANGELFIGDATGVVSKIGGIDTATEGYVDAAVAVLQGTTSTSVNDLQAQINAEIAAREAEDTNLLNNLISLNDTVNQVQINLNNETTGRITADNALHTRIDEVSADIANIISNTDPTALDSLTEIVAAFQSADSDLNSAITQLANDASASRNAISNELDATQVGAGLEVDGSYVADATTNYLSTAVSLKDADAKLDAAIKAEVDARIAAVSALEAAFIAEVGLIETAIADEVAARTAGDTTLQSNIDAEAALRVAGDNAVNARLDNLVAAQVAFTPFDSAQWNDPVDESSVAPTNVNEALERLIDGVEMAVREIDSLDTYVNNLSATAIGFTDSTALLGAADVQAAIEALKVLVDNVESGSNTAIENLTAADIVYDVAHPNNYGNFNFVADYVEPDPDQMYAQTHIDPVDHTVEKLIKNLRTDVSKLYAEINKTSIDAGVILKSMARQAASAVAITGGTIENVTLSNVQFDGGTF